MKPGDTVYQLDDLGGKELAVGEVVQAFGELVVVYKQKSAYGGATSMHLDRDLTAWHRTKNAAVAGKLDGVDKAHAAERKRLLALAGVRE